MGFENSTGSFTELFCGGIPIIANITNLHLLPFTGFTLIVLPLVASPAGGPPGNAKPASGH